MFNVIIKDTGARRQRAQVMRSLQTHREIYESTKTYYTCEGDMSIGCGHQHRTKHRAENCLAWYEEECRRAGGFSDRKVVMVTEIRETAPTNR